MAKFIKGWSKRAMLEPPPSAEEDAPAMPSSLPADRGSGRATASSKTNAQNSDNGSSSSRLLEDAASSSSRLLEEAATALLRGFKTERYPGSDLDDVRSAIADTNGGREAQQGCVSTSDGGASSSSSSSAPPTRNCGNRREDDGAGPGEDEGEGEVNANGKRPRAAVAAAAGGVGKEVKARNSKRQKYEYTDFASKKKKPPPAFVASTQHTNAAFPAHDPCALLVLHQQQQQQAVTSLPMSISSSLCSSSDGRFPSKLYSMLATPRFASIISWLPHGRSWKIWNVHLLEERVLPLYFGCANYNSFLRLVNAWRFRRIRNKKKRPQGGQGGGDPSQSDYNSYYHDLFLRSRPDLYVKMKRLPKRAKKLPMDKSSEPDFDALPPLPELTASDGGELHRGAGAVGIPADAKVLQRDADSLLRESASLRRQAESGFAPQPSPSLAAAASVPHLGSLMAYLDGSSSSSKPATTFDAQQDTMASAAHAADARAGIDAALHARAHADRERMRSELGERRDRLERHLALAATLRQRREQEQEEELQRRTRLDLEMRRRLDRELALERATALLFPQEDTSRPGAATQLVPQLERQSVLGLAGFVGGGGGPMDPIQSPAGMRSNEALLSSLRSFGGVAPPSVAAAVQTPSHPHPSTNETVLSLIRRHGLH